MTLPQFITRDASEQIEQKNQTAKNGAVPSVKHVDLLKTMGKEPMKVPSESTEPSSKAPDRFQEKV